MARRRDLPSLRPDPGPRAGLVRIAAAWLVGAAFAGSAALAAEPSGTLPKTTTPRPVPTPVSEAADPKVAIPVEIAQAREQCFTLQVPMTGYVRARRDAVVVLLPGDTVTEVAAAEGDAVTADQVLAQVSRPPRAPAAPAAPARAETVALRAPVAGTIVQSRAAAGMVGSATATEPLFLIAVDGKLEFEADVQSLHVPKLSVGQPARVMVDRGELRGEVRLIPASIDPRTQFGKARIAFDGDPRPKFLAFASAVVDARRSCGVSIPRTAVEDRAGGANVLVVESDAVRSRAVKVGLSSDTDVEIIEGLSNDDRVVLHAGTSLRDGDKVAPFGASAMTYGER